MKNYHLILILFFSSFFTNTLLADGGEDGISEMTIKLCSGESMTWEEYLEMRKCMEEDGLAIPEVEFVPFEVFSYTSNVQKIT